jgi:hypothetical protein
VHWEENRVILNPVAIATPGSSNVAALWCSQAFHTVIESQRRSQPTSGARPRPTQPNHQTTLQNNTTSASKPPPATTASNHSAPIHRPAARSSALASPARVPCPVQPTAPAPLLVVPFRKRPHTALYAHTQSSLIFHPGFFTRYAPRPDCFLARCHTRILLLWVCMRPSRCR